MKIWHEVSQSKLLKYEFISFIYLINFTYKDPNINDTLKLEYDFIYLAHPRSVTSISWRQITKFMPR